MKAIIIGSGIGGLATAIALQQVGIEVAVYEQASEARAIGAGITLWANAILALKKLGVLEALGTDMAEVRGGIHRWDGVQLSHLDADEIKRRYGAVSIGVHRLDLMHALMKKAGDVVQYGKRLKAYQQQPDRIDAIFEDDTHAEADVLIGADGIHSLVRRQMNPMSTPIYRGYGAWRSVIDFSHEAVNNMWGETWGRGARFGIVALSQQRVYWFATANRPANTPPSNHHDTLNALFGTWHAPIATLIAHTPKEALLYNDISDLEPLQTWVDGRAVLLGDSAHAMTPNMGQGACQAIEDALVLAKCLHAHGSLSDKLAAYQQQRLAHTRQVVLQSRLIGRIGQVSHPVITRVRDGIMRLTPPQASLRQFHFVLSNRI